MIVVEDCFSKLVGTFQFVQYFFNHLSQLHIVDISEQKKGFNDPPKLFQSPVKWMLLGTGTQSYEKL
jgi:hypothetical protein